MIAVCSSCQAQYSVADAKVQGRKVRVTCKHCQQPFIIDGLSQPPVVHPIAAAPVAPTAVKPTAPPRPETKASTLSSVMPRRSPFSVHDEETVIGRIPLEALEAERRFSRQTPPAPAPAAVSSAESALPASSTADGAREAAISTPPAAPIGVKDPEVDTKSEAAITTPPAAPTAPTAIEGSAVDSAPSASAEGASSLASDELPVLDERVPEKHETTRTASPQAIRASLPAVSTAAPEPDAPATTRLWPWLLALAILVLVFLFFNSR